VAVDSTGLEVGGRCAGELIGFGQLLFFPLFSLFFPTSFPAHTRPFLFQLEKTRGIRTIHKTYTRTHGRRRPFLQSAFWRINGVYYGIYYIVFEVGFFSSNSPGERPTMYFGIETGWGEGKFTH